MAQRKKVMRARRERGSTGDKHALELDGVVVGWLESVEGGDATADVVTERVGPDHVQRKHLAGVKYEDVTVTCGAGMSSAFYQWVRDSLDRRYTRRNGAIRTADTRSRELSRLNFTNALISEVGFPALDAASKDALTMTIKFAPEYTRIVRPERGGLIKPGPGKGAQKKWLPANFRIRIDGLEEACARVSQIEALVIKQKVTERAIGDVRDYQKEPATVEIPNLVITLPESHAKPVYDWHEDFVIRGNNSDDKEKGGTLEYLAPNLTDALFTLTFKGLGIFRLTPVKVESGREQIRRVKAEMYCEEMKFDYKAP